MNRIPFSSFSSFSDLFKDYTENFEKLAPFFASDYRDPAALQSTIEKVAAKHPDRSALIDALSRQAESFGILEASAPLIEKISNPESVAVVTGQQLGLFGGPLYTLYKIITAIQLADQIETSSGRPAVPVFWLEGEDHDFDEIAGAGFLQGDDAIKVRYTPEDTDSIETAIGRLVISGEIEASLEQLEEILQPTEFSGPLMGLMRKAYAPGQTMLQAFVTVMNAMLGEGRVLYLSPDDPGLKKMASPLFKREITDFETSSGRLGFVSERIEALYHAQVQSRPLNLFIHGDERRTSIDVSDAGFVTRDGQAFSKEELLTLLESDPGAFSPNVVMRPLMQDTVLPTAIYVAGPGEVAYFAQFKPLYEWANIPMPVIYPRASVTLYEKRISKIVDKNALTLTDFEEQLDRLFRQVVLDNMESNPEDDFKAASRFLHQAINEIKPVVEKVDRSLVKSADATRNALMKEWSRLQDRVIKAERQQHDVVKNQLNRASSNLFPFEIPQERALSPVYFLNKYGPEFGQKLINTLDLDTTSHQIIEP